MKKLLLLLIPLSCFAGDPPLEVGVSFNTYWAARKAPITGYTKINASYEWLRGYFDSTFHVPNGTTPGLNGGYNHAGALYYKTGDSSLYVYTGTQWRTVSGSGSTPTIQQVLTAGSTLTTNNTVAGGNFTWTHDNSGTYTVNSNADITFNALSGQVNLNADLFNAVANSGGGIILDAKGNLTLLNQTNLSTQDRLLGIRNSSGLTGTVTLGSGLSLSSGVLNTSGTVPTPISSLTAATGTNSIDNTTFLQTWNWTGMTGGGISLNAATTAGVSNHKLFQANLSGALSTPSISSYAGWFTNTHTGTTIDNYGIRAVASGGTTNTGGYFSGTEVGINIAGGALTLNGSAGTSGQVLTSAGANTLPTWTTPSPMVYPGAGIPNSTGSAWGTSYSTTGSGTVVALATQPTFTTDITTPMIVGGSATGQKITLKTTTGVGSGDSILFKGGNNGATTYASIQSAGLNLLDNSYLKIGGSNILHFNTGSNNATFAGAYNFLFNNGGNVFMNSANTTYFSTSTGDLYFSGSGKLGIGTASPGGPLHVKANAGAIDALFVDGTTGNVGIGTATPSVALDVVGNIHGTGATTLDLSGTGLNVLVGGEIQLFIDNTNGDWILGDAANAFSNKVRISGDNAGDIISLDAATVKFVNYGAGAATFDASGNISSVSDIRLKNVQGGYNVGLSALMKIKPIVYKWNEKSKMETEHNYIGFSAQNILSALGQDATGINKDGYLSIQDRAIMATMVVAIQEQQKMIETLQKEIKKLKRK